MELSEMNLVDVETRLSALDKEVAEMKEVEDIDKATEEKRSLLERKAELEKIEQRKSDAIALTNGEAKAEKIIEERKDDNKMNIVELRNSAEYVHAYANFVKTGKDAECRALLTTNATEATGYIPVPDLVDSAVRHAWEKEQIMALVTKTNLKGNVKVGFELSADGALIHKEGDDAPAEEELTLGIITMIPETIKKWISISDEVLDMDDGSYLQYVYSELTYRIAKKASDMIIAEIVALPTTATATSVAAAQVASEPALDTVAKAIANLSDEATNPVIVMNKLTYADFKKAQYDNNFSVDPFEGLKVVFNNSLPAYSATTTGDIYMIVGDFGRGVQANFPNGETISVKYDQYTLATEDLVRLIGRLPMAVGCVGPNCFVNVCQA